LDVVVEGSRTDIKLSRSDAVTEVQDWPTFCQKIGAEPNPGNRLSEAIILNGLGSAGWELVGVYRPDATPPVTRYIFKWPSL
jgi:hypothetical protein